MADAGQNIPEEVLEAYGVASGSVEPVKGGMVNATFFAVTEDGRQVVLQRLGEMFEEGVVDDFHKVTDHLDKQGWEVPTTVLTFSGELSLRDGKGELWRASTRIENDGVTPSALDKATLHAVGEQLGRLHKSLASLDYDPQYKIPHFHETPYYVQKLKGFVSELPSRPAEDMAAEVLDDYRQLPELPDMGDQLLHGDPRTNNMLYRNGNPFTFIDFDTIMRGAVWVDIGDLLRSLAEDAAEKETTIPLSDLRKVTDGYLSGAGLDVDAAEFFEHSLTAGKVIALELTMRFLADTVEPYFSFDAEKYASRLEFDMERASLQRQVYHYLGHPNQD